MVSNIPEENFILRLPSYDKLLTPVNGAYFLILMVLVFGGTWVCCACRKKHRNEVPYQELEMALPESASATNVESAEGWDQDWDDDWDVNVAVKSPAALAGSISANGLTSRSSNKDGWENNWDDQGYQEAKDKGDDRINQKVEKERKGKHQSWGRLRARDVRNVAVLGPNFDACPCKGLQKRKEEV